MHASRLLFVSAATAALVLLGGCGSILSDTTVDPRSPIAAEVARVSRANTDFPSFKEIPGRPTDVRPLRAYGEAADVVDTARANLERDTAPGTWSLNGTEAFAAKARVEAGPEATPGNPAATEAFAQDLRARATPPPPPKR